MPLNRPNRKIIVLDFETTGLDEFQCSNVSCAALDVEHPDEQDMFNRRCRMWVGAEIGSGSLERNRFNFEQITDRRLITDEQLMDCYMYWAKNHPIIDGQVPIFDTRFANAALHAYGNPFMFYSGENLQDYFNEHRKNRGVQEMKYPNLTTIGDYCGLPIEEEAHTARIDVLLTSECFSRFWDGKNLIKRYKDYSIPIYLKK
ncbi:MAG: hypothetical protein AABW88_00820 [Nanoarchaeota archaeon]